MLPVPVLSRGIVGLGDRRSVRCDHELVQSSRVFVLMNVFGWVHYYLAFVFTEEEANSQEKKDIHKAPDPSWEYKEEVVGTTRDDFILDGVAVVRRSSVFAIKVAP